MITGKRYNKQFPPEEWRTIDRIEFAPRWGSYEVSNYGRVRHAYNDKEKKMLKPYFKSGAHRGSDFTVVKLCLKEIRVAHLVWNAFKGPIRRGMYIIHINGMKEDNSLWNLREVNRRELGTMFAELSECGKKNRRTIVRIDRDGNILDVYRSSRIAEKEYGCLCYQSILNRCNHKVKRNQDEWLPDGTTFRWEEEVMNEE